MPGKLDYILQNLKPLLIGSGIGFGVPLSAYTAGKIGEIATRQGNINETLENIKTRTLPLSIGASLLGGLTGSALVDKYAEPSEPELPNYYMNKYQSYKEEFISQLTKTANKIDPKLLMGLLAAIPTAGVGAVYGDDIINAASAPIDKELDKGELTADIAEVALPAAAGLVGAGTGAGATYLNKKLSSFSNVCDMALVKEAISKKKILSAAANDLRKGGRSKEDKVIKQLRNIFYNDPKGKNREKLGTTMLEDVVDELGLDRIYDPKRAINLPQDIDDLLNIKLPFSGERRGLSPRREHYLALGSMFNKYVPKEDLDYSKLLNKILGGISGVGALGTGYGLLKD